MVVARAAIVLIGILLLFPTEPPVTVTVVCPEMHLMEGVFMQVSIEYSGPQMNTHPVAFTSIIKII